MLLVLLVTALAAGLAVATGGRLSRLADLSMDGLGWLAAAAAVQLLGSVLGGIVDGLYPLALLTSAVLVGVFLRQNLRHPGVALLALGFVTNAVVVMLNGAMPVSAATLARAGVPRGPAALDADPRHEMVHQTTLLPWLGDVVPVVLPGIGQAVSPGDLLIAAGAGLLVFTAMGGGRPPAAVSWSELEAARHHTP